MSLYYKIGNWFLISKTMRHHFQNKLFGIFFYQIFYNFIALLKWMILILQRWNFKFWVTWIMCRILLIIFLSNRKHFTWQFFMKTDFWFLKSFYRLKKLILNFILFFTIFEPNEIVVKTSVLITFLMSAKIIMNIFRSLTSI